MPLSVPHQEPEPLAAAPIAMALAQLRFPRQLTLARPEAVAPVQTALNGLFPLPNREQQIMVVENETVTSNRWRFADAEGTTALVVAEDWIALETRAYQTWPWFRGLLEQTLAAFLEAVSIPQVSRIGLRYVNELRHPDAVSAENWAPYIAPGLFHPPPPALGTEVISSVEAIRVPQKDGEVFALHHGFVARPPAPEASPFYLLDFDYYNDVPSSPALEAILTTLDGYNAAIYDVFRWSVEDAYLDHLRGGDAG